MYNVKDMSDEAFDTLMANYKKASDDKIAAEKQAEKERAQKEESDRIYFKRLNELAPYSDFTDEKVLTVTTEKEYKKILATAIASKKVHDDKQASVRKENKALKKKADTDRKAKEQAETKLREAKEAQARKIFTEKKIAEAKDLAEAEAKQKALLAPDKEKLEVFAGRIEGAIEANAPALQSKTAKDLLDQAEMCLRDAVTDLREYTKTL